MAKKVDSRTDEQKEFDEWFYSKVGRVESRIVKHIAMLAWFEAKKRFEDNETWPNTKETMQ